MYNIVGSNALVEKYQESDMVVTCLYKFLDRKKLSDPTKIGYEHDIKEFFGVKSLEDITFDDIIDVTKDSAQEYFDGLELAYATKLRRLNAISSLYDYLMSEWTSNRMRLSLLLSNPLKEVEIIGKSESYGVIPKQLAIKVMEMGLPEERLYFELLIRTAVRSEAIRKLNLNESFKQENGYWFIIGEDKGKNGVRSEFKEPISDELYNKCCEFADSKGVIFHFSHSTVYRHLIGYLKKCGLSGEEIKERKLTLHSFKSTSIDIASDMVDSLKELQEHAHHGNINTTAKFYLGKDKEVSNDVGIRMDLSGKSLEDELGEKLWEMDKVDMYNLIMSMDEGFKKKMLRKIEGKSVLV